MTIETENVVNHEEAFQLANLRRGNSNLARCYLELSDRIDVLERALARHNCGKRVPVKCICVECCELVDARALTKEAGIHGEGRNAS